MAESPAGLIVRPALPADLPAIAAMREIKPEEFSAYAGWVAAHTTSHLPFVAELDGHVVGNAWLHVAERVPGSGAMDRWYGDVQSVMVLEEYRNRGIGAALIEAILAEATTRGLLHVAVRSGRRAVDFYARNGFEHHRQLLLWEPEQ